MHNHSFLLHLIAYLELKMLTFDSQTFTVARMNKVIYSSRSYTQRTTVSSLHHLIVGKQHTPSDGHSRFSVSLSSWSHVQLMLFLHKKRIRESNHHL